MVRKHVTLYRKFAIRNGSCFVMSYFQYTANKTALPSRRNYICLWFLFIIVTMVCTSSPPSASFFSLHGPNKQGRIHGSPCRGWLGRGSDKLGRGSNELGRGGKGRSHAKSKSVTDRPTDTATYRSRCPRQKSLAENSESHKKLYHFRNDS